MTSTKFGFLTALILATVLSACGVDRQAKVEVTADASSSDLRAAFIGSAVGTVKGLRILNGTRCFNLVTDDGKTHLIVQPIHLVPAGLSNGDRVQVKPSGQFHYIITILVNH